MSKKLFKPTFKKYFFQIDDHYLSKTTKRINSKNYKNRYGALEEQEQEDSQPINTDNLADELEDTADVDPELGVGPDGEFEEPEEPEDPDKQGVIRVIKGARLVFKRQTEHGDFEELWIFNSGDHIKDSLKIQRAILASTDILPKRTKSQDGTQSYELTTIGNAQLIHIEGLPN
ncbi:MAG: hypothetical protein ACREAU_00585 [Nitrosopumilaceae archaeon]